MNAPTVCFYFFGANTRFSSAARPNLRLTTSLDLYDSIARLRLMKRSERTQRFVEEIWKWYARHKRALPWRDLTDKDDSLRAYKIMVSEIMLQQTQVERVQTVFRRFIREFPSASALAQASSADVIRAWRGMGYNSRALRLRDACRVLQSDYEGRFPKEMQELLSIKGIGPYTAAAIRNFAFDLPTPCIDTNIRRVYHRTFYGPERSDGSWPRSDDRLLKLAEDILKEAIDPERKTEGIRHTAAQWHAAIMDFGSAVCTKRSPKWDICPLTAHGICKASYKVPKYVPKKRVEPGRNVGATFVPNRIFRGRTVEQLRDESYLNIEEIGARICPDWSEEHVDWLRTLLSGLEKDGMVTQRDSRYSLVD